MTKNAPTSARTQLMLHLAEGEELWLNIASEALAEARAEGARAVLKLWNAEEPSHNPTAAVIKQLQSDIHEYMKQA